MSMKVEILNEIAVAILNQDEKIYDIQDVLDFMADAHYSGCTAMVLDKGCLDDKFFDLKTGFAGEVLQKFSNYDMKIAIIGDFSSYPSQSLQDFIYECNKGNRVYFKATVEDGLKALAGS
ncbi:MAG: DUF4180 domain-containing protein [Methylocystaceae bacterium]